MSELRPVDVVILLILGVILLCELFTLPVPK